jgi:hypothetical protein
MAKKKKVSTKTNKKRPPKELQEFKEKNPEIRILDTPNGWMIDKPWNDESVLFIVKRSNKNALKSFSQVRFPPKFSAIIHLDSNDIEFIYTHLPPDNLLLRRKFSLQYNKKNYECEYAPSSDRLKFFADCFRINGISDTSYRNLSAVKYEKREKHILTSFWIRNAKINEGELLQLAQHINFYMVFYDNDSPAILIHNEINDDPLPRTKYDFPESIPAHLIEPYLLNLWHIARESSDFQRFIHYYQVLEYAAFVYLKEKIYNQIKKIILKPHPVLEESFRQILHATTEENLSDESKIEIIIEENTHIDLLWRIIQDNKIFFSEKTVFDGGLTIKPIITKDTTFEEFKISWHPAIARDLKEIRNKLVHAREKRQSETIFPTPENMDKLRPWTELMNEIANHVICFNR